MALPRAGPRFPYKAAGFYTNPSKSPPGGVRANTLIDPAAREPAPGGASGGLPPRSTRMVGIPGPGLFGAHAGCDARIGSCREAASAAPSPPLRTPAGPGGNRVTRIAMARRIAGRRTAPFGARYAHPEPLRAARASASSPVARPCSANPRVRRVRLERVTAPA